MSGCNHDCDQGRRCTCRIEAAPSQDRPMSFAEIRDGIANAVEDWPHNDYYPPTIAEMIRQIGPTPQAAPSQEPHGFMCLCDACTRPAASQEPFGYVCDDYDIESGSVALYQVKQESFFGRVYRNMPVYRMPPDAAAQIAFQKRLKEICEQDNERLTAVVRGYEKQIAQLEADFELLRSSDHKRFMQAMANGEKANKLEAAARMAREALMAGTAQDQDEALAAIDAVLSGAPSSELSDGEIWGIAIANNLAGADVGSVLAFARAVLKEGRK